MNLHQRGRALVTSLFLLAAGLAPLATRAAATSGVPAFDHIFTIVMENTSASSILGNTGEAPYINGLAAKYGTATNYSAISHPSLPNYLALTAGSELGVTDDCNDCFQAAPNIAVDRVEASGRTWKAYMESMPALCSPGDSGDGLYVQHHNPFYYFDDIRTNPSECGKIVPFSGFGSDISSAATTANYVWISPNNCNNMHDCSIGTGDTWLSRTVPAILGSPAFTSQNSALFITWDEDDSSTNSNKVATLVVAKSVPAGFRTSTAYNHYSLLKTIESAWGLAPLTSNDAAATPMSAFFGSPTPTPTPTPTPKPTPTPTPTPTPKPTPTPTPTPAPTPSPTPPGSAAVFAQDSFAGRSTAAGWGTASDGNTWTLQAGIAGVLSVSGNEGRVLGSGAMGTVRATLGTHTAADTDVVARYTSADYANDNGHLVSRFSGTGTYYAAGLDSPNGTPELNIMKVSGGSQTRVAGVAFAAVNGTSYWERTRVVTSGSGAVISVRAWKDGTAEPGGWNLTYTDSSPLPAGRAGIESWDDGLGWKIDHFAASVPGGTTPTPTPTPSPTPTPKPTPTPTPTPSPTPTPAPGSPSGVAMPTGNIPGWNMAFSDDFGGTSLNPAAWGTYNGQPGGDPGGWWDPSHVVVNNGVLELQTYKDPAFGNRWVSGGVSSAPALTQQYGKYLVRFRMDKGNGVAGILLLWPSNGGWPPEIDFAEDGGGNRSQSTATLHYGSNDSQVQQSVTADFSQWHTMGVEWTAGVLRFTLDGAVWATMSSPNVPSIPMELDAQAQAGTCGDQWTPCPDATTPAHVTMQIDWVAAYRPA